jgi:hypothetical protein
MWDTGHGTGELRASGVGWALGGGGCIHRGWEQGRMHVVTWAQRVRSPVARAQRIQFYFDLREGVRRMKAVSGRRPKAGRPGG